MKTRILLTVGMLMFFTGSISSRGATQTQNAPEKETITVWSTPEVEVLTGTLVSAYGKLHPNLAFKMQELPNQVLTENLNKPAGVVFYAQESDFELKDNSLLQMVVGRDVIVPVMNAGNPFYTDLENSGVSVKKFREAVITNEAIWDIFLENNVTAPLKIYVLDDNLAQSAVAAFLNVHPEMLTTFEARPANEIIRLVQKDKYAIGFCRLNDLAPLGQQEMVENVKLLPIDKNGNGRIDYHEKIYTNLNDFKRGVWIGKYPGTLIHKIYTVSSIEPGNENVTEFLSWVVTEGQQFMETNGFSELVYNERQSRLDKLYPQQIVLEPNEPQSAKTKTYFLIALGMLVLTMIAGFVYRKRGKKSKLPLGVFPKYIKVLTENVLSFPKGLYFDKSHTWIYMEKEGLVKVGIDDFIPKVTGDFTRVILKNPGDKVKRKEPIVTLVQKGKHIYIHAPVSGTIKEINEALVADPFTINHSPYGRGWVYKIEPSNWMREIHFFKLGAIYKEWITSEINRLKDFLACSFNIKHLEEGNLVIQEGGEIIAYPLKELGPEMWEDFQNYFIETADMY